MAALLPFKVPQISEADMFAFHEAHFSNMSTGHFESHFLHPNYSVVASNSAATEGPESGNAVEEDYHYEGEYEEGYYDEDDDGLGYYPDGVKRTLTDEQIAIFRHSELEAMRRVRESAKIKKVMDPAADGVAVVIEGAIGEQLSDGEVDSSPREAGAGPQHHQQQKKKKNNNNNNKSKNKRRGGKKNNNNRPDGGEQIDLRKRTWDVVDKGLASLDYGEEENGQPSDERAMQRRRISYDD
ncbi:hypothetical protein QBC32DRAFT_117369 [Pseudoneurospora amorphoporcata]|uniref:Uncharacterized protein n=1 Tax=Pseudoneurospora amorphoporcata TaxID=241081 RepID=A0AAN6SHE3_9PEZI|nr:hypothetical protein QBC32DRAFT_117369 [Pseudoneurospora amorphoporcata]